MSEGGGIVGQATGFEFYEGIRIVVPGAIVVALAIGVGKTFDLHSARLGDTALGGAAAALLSGLFFYFLDAPSKAAISGGNVPNGDRPSDVLQRIGQAKVGGVVNTYFVILDTAIPPGIRTRALYMGSMFRIGFEAIYLVAFTSAGVLLALVAGAGPTTTENQFDAKVGLIALIVAALAVCAFVHRAERDPPPPADGRTWPCPTPGDAALLAAAVATTATLTALVHQSGLLAIGPGLAFAHWAIRYFSGWSGAQLPPPAGAPTASGPSGAKNRRPANRKTGVVLFSVPTLTILVDVLVRTYAKQHPDATHVIPWSALLTLTLTLIAARGHETRLFGSYKTQITWLLLHEAELLGEYLKPHPRAKRRAAPASPAPPSPPRRTAEWLSAIWRALWGVPKP